MNATRPMVAPLVSLFAAVLVTAVEPASAQVGAAGTDNWGTYAGAGVGDSDFDTGIKAFFGQQFHPYVAWEAQFMHFGERTIRRADIDVKTSAWSAGASAVGIFPLNQQFDIFGKLGAHYVKTRVRGAGGSDSEFELGIGAGARIKINDRFSIRIEVEDIGDAGDVVSASVQYRF